MNRINECDTIFLLDLPTEVCLNGAKERIGTVRDDLPWVEKSLDDNFKNLILEFKETKLPEIYKLLEKYKSNKKIIIFKNREEIDNYINEL